MSIVGGNLAEIGANEESLRTTASAAGKTGADTGSAAGVLQAAIVDATAELVRTFESIATELRTEIDRAARQLEATDWQGRSRERALLVEAELKSQVTRVMDAATTTLTGEQKAFCDRAEVLVGEIDGRFAGVMEQVGVEYEALGRAARLTMENFEAADQTIYMG